MKRRHYTTSLAQRKASLRYKHRHRKQVEKEVRRTNAKHYILHDASPVGLEDVKRWLKQREEDNQ